MAAKRHSKTWEQQAKYYEVDNIAEYMVETYLNGNISTFRELYRHGGCIVRWSHCSRHSFNRKRRRRFVQR